ncbi:hypothetical protein EV182_000384 [Spiromyces aspiralis]|uniref:Uncharacterized protein n=1 Tax=Spiromyces aspiralis TaxID=68401 RepID=A0ACC1HUK0_9FUNG|nr:hypothetical protein EV182_000384 [Spiromyces aspiralis]
MQLPVYHSVQPRSLPSPAGNNEYHIYIRTRAASRERTPARPWDAPTHDNHLALLLNARDSAAWSAWKRARYILRQAWAGKESRSILSFLVLNLSYMLVQIVYGYTTNSLGLLSDAIHMFFDCTALGIGLVASIMSKWQASDRYSYGYTRVEVLAGFANGISLMIISISILCEALGRLIDPPEMETTQLLVVSVGIFLHVLADTMGSAGVIVSTILIKMYGWTGFDPLASILIAGLIFFSVIPLVKSTIRILLLRLPSADHANIDAMLAETRARFPEIVGFPAVRFWPLSEDRVVGHISVLVPLQPADTTAAAQPSPTRPSGAVARYQAIVLAIKELGTLHIPGLDEVTVQISFE